MCGILGIVGKEFAKNNNWIKENIIKISHRGPDDRGIWNSSDQLVCFGHTRLSILDLSSKNHQPLIDEERKVSLIFNGEIYNYLDLRTQLENLGHRFKTNGDTEVLLKSYIQWKEECFKKIEGMFAFSICDERIKKVFLVRDQYGQKPLYFKYFNQTLKFGSELQLFLNDPDSKLNINNLNKYLFFGFVKNNSLINNVNQLPPGHFLEFNYEKKISQIYAYWKIPQKIKKQKLDNFEILELLKNSLKNQIRSDVSTGFLLSGGIDSSLLVALTSEISQKKVYTFNVSYNEDASKIESKNAKLVSDMYNTHHMNLNIDKLDITSFLEILEKFDEPIIDSSVIPTFLIYNQIKDKCKVVIGGDGGDEIFGGYKHFQNFLIYDSLNSFSKSTIKLIYKFFHKDFFFYRKGSMYLDLIRSNERIIDIPNYFNNQERLKVFKDQKLFYQNNIEKDISEDIVVESMRNSFENYLPEDILFKIDRCSMLNSIEARTPYLDKKLVDYIFKNSKGKNHVSFLNRRKVQKEISKPYLPNKILNQKKRGFSFNLNNQLKNRIWKNEIYYILTSKDCLFSKNYIDHLFKMHSIGHNVSEKIFGLLFFEIWKKKYKI
jgi:asparagine synthase (glutamine-hydrolysing)